MTDMLVTPAYYYVWSRPLIQVIQLNHSLDDHEQDLDAHRLCILDSPLCVVSFSFFCVTQAVVCCDIWIRKLREINIINNGYWVPTSSFERKTLIWLSFYIPFSVSIKVGVTIVYLRVLFLVLFDQKLQMGYFVQHMEPLYVLNCFLSAVIHSSALLRIRQ